MTSVTTYVVLFGDQNTDTLGLSVPDTAIDFLRISSPEFGNYDLHGEMGPISDPSPVSAFRPIRALLDEK